MAKFKVLKVFKDVHTNEVYKANDIIEMTVNRAKEVETNLKDKGVFLERIQEKGDK